MSQKERMLDPISTKAVLAVCLIDILLGMAGCVISPRRGPGASSAAQSAAGQIYVSNSSANTILRFANAPQANGNVVPAATISGPATQLASPQYLLLDSKADRLFISNQTSGSIVIFEKASTRNGNTAPDRTIGGAATGMASPVDLALDTSRDEIYVSDGTNVLVFAAASTATGNVAPVRSAALGFVISSIFLDSASDRLFVADGGNNAVDIYDSAHLLNHISSPNRIISGPNTLLAQPSGLQKDSGGRLIVSNFSSASVTIFANAATVNGNVGPVAVINGASTSMGEPNQTIVAATSSGGDLYIADGAAASVLVFSNIDSLNGNSAPTRNIHGTNTGLGRSAGGTGPPTARGIAVDITR